MKKPVTVDYEYLVTTARDFPALDAWEVVKIAAVRQQRAENRPFVPAKNRYVREYDFENCKFIEAYFIPAYRWVNQSR